MPLQRRIAARLKNTLPKAPEPPASTTQILYYHTDHLGTPRELTNAEGHIVWEARYKAWGRVHQIDYPAVPHTIADGNTQRQVWIDTPPDERPVQNLRFQGQYHDEETGLHYNRFRYYDPDVGRFASQDPIGLAGGVNTYQYAPNLVVWVDPLGLCKCPGEAPKTLSDVFTGGTPKASDLKRYAEDKGWRPTQTDGGPLKYVDENGISRITIKQGSSRAPGSSNPHVELKNASSQRIDPTGNLVTRKSPSNHTPIDYDL